jgi:hypothetical protein
MCCDIRTCDLHNEGRKCICTTYHYEKSSPSKPHYPIIRAPKELIYNYTTIKAWKYEQLIIKMSHQKITKLYYNYNLIANGTPIR